MYSSCSENVFKKTYPIKWNTESLNRVQEIYRSCSEFVSTSPNWRQNVFWTCTYHALEMFSTLSNGRQNLRINVVENSNVMCRDWLQSLCIPICGKFLLRVWFWISPRQSIQTSWQLAMLSMWTPIAFTIASGWTIDPIQYWIFNWCALSFWRLQVITLEIWPQFYKTVANHRTQVVVNLSCLTLADVAIC